MDRLQAMQTFRAVVETGSFAAGARKLDRQLMPARLQALIETLIGYFDAEAACPDRS